VKKISYFSSAFMEGVTILSEKREVKGQSALKNSNCWMSLKKEKNGAAEISV
jgi:hypothetical protein